jgi:NADH dehydrogenase
MVSMEDALPRIVIVGGGAGGLELATALGQSLGKRGRAAITLIDRTATHLWKPRLHEVAAGLLSAAEDEVSYAAQGFAHGFQFVLGPMEGLDPERREVLVGGVVDAGSGEPIVGPRRVHYDYLVLALGSRVNDFNTPGVAEHCHLLDSVEQAERLHKRFLARAFQVQNGEIERLTVGIVGAGATGVELASELHYAVYQVLRYGGMLQPEKLDVTVVDLAPRVLPAVAPEVSAYAQRQLDERKIRTVLGQRVVSVSKDAMELSDGQVIHADIKVWASGIKGHDFLASCAGLPLARNNQIIVDATLRCAGSERIFAMGDCAQFTPPGAERPVPATAQAAHQQAALLARSLRGVIEGRPPLPFRFRYRGTLVSLGHGKAAGELPSLRQGRGNRSIYGSIAKLAYASLYRMHLAALFGWPRTLALVLSDMLRRATRPPVKLH